MTTFTPRYTTVCARLEFADLPHGGPENLAFCAHMSYTVEVFPDTNRTFIPLNSSVESIIIANCRSAMNVLCPGRPAPSLQSGFRFQG